MLIIIQADAMKTEINSLKKNKKGIDGSLKCFCGGFGNTDSGYPKRFFSAVTTEYFCYRKSINIIRKNSCS
jgi:hypothetical protein